MLVVLLLLVLYSTDGFKTIVNKKLHTRNNAFINLDNGEPIQVLKHLGDYQPSEPRDLDKMKKEMQFNLNMGKAMETLRRELPMAFHVSNLDFSIFANQITVCNGNVLNKMSMPKTLYSAAVKSLRVASSISFTQPTMNVKKIEYIEDCRTIQCLVDVVLPDTVRIEGQSTWEGMFYFGLDSDGFIETHIFDRKITNYFSSPKRVSDLNYPWLQSAAAQWNQDLIRGSPVPQYAAEGTESLKFPIKSVPSNYFPPDELNLEEL